MKKKVLALLLCTALTATMLTACGGEDKEANNGAEESDDGQSQESVEPAEVIIIEGILVFTCKELREQMDIKIFVDADDEDRLMRVMARDIIERGKTVEKVIERYTKTVKPMYLQFIEPSKRYADIIIPQGGHNKVAIDVISATIEKSLNAKNAESGR